MHLSCIPIHVHIAELAAIRALLIRGILCPRALCTVAELYGVLMSMLSSFLPSLFHDDGALK